MDSPEILSTLDSRNRTKTNKPNYTTQKTTKMSYTVPTIHKGRNEELGNGKQLLCLIGHPSCFT